MASIQLNQVSLTFPVYSAKGRSLKNSVIAKSTGGYIKTDADNRILIKALDNISLNLENGDRLGLVGHNGAGKTTLLRVLAGIYEPFIGKVSIQGNVAPFFDISLGMDFESTGYENILLRGLYLGLSKTEIQSKINEIADFTELGSFLDMPLRTYSAGMQARLAFAISTCIEPEILLVDEGIGAGDAAFIDKATRRLDSFIAQAHILVLASHSEALIRRLCNKAILMKHGSMVAIGSVDEVFKEYNAGAN